MRQLLACTCLTPILLIAAGAPAAAETTISTKTTNGLRTSTVKSGAADDIKIGTGGSVEPSAAGFAITIDSNHSVKNEGAIAIRDLSDSVGIFANAGTAGTISNSGKIEVIENYTASDADKDGDEDGAFASGARRFGIRIAPDGTFTGNVENSGTIAVEGNDSVAIAADSRLAGSLTSSGTMTVLGDRAMGVRASEVTGDVRLTGSITATGVGAVGASFDGNIGGALTIQGTVAASGYRYTSAPSDSSKLDADDLLQGGPALRVSGNVAKGILFDAPPADKSSTDNDEDKDGVEDSKEGTASIVSSGAAPAVQIGAAAHQVNIGAVAGNSNGHGMVVNGGISGRGVYKDVNGTGLVIGGLGGAVQIAGGLTVNGQVVASSNGATATAIRVGSGATVNEIRVAGIVQADGKSGRAIRIDQGATVTAIRNSGKIAAGAGGDGSAAAIVDEGGKLALIENSGAISAGGVGPETGRAIAIDLRSNASGAIVRQTQVGQGVAPPSIAGNILFGAGDDLLDLADGEVKGATQFGTGANRLAMSNDAVFSGKAEFGGGSDRVTLAGTSVLAGTVDFGGGGDTLSLSGTARFSGALLNAAALAVDVSGGTLDVSNLGTVQIGSLAVGSQGVLGVTIDAANGKATLYQVAGAASFAPGAKFQVKLASVGDSLGKFTVLQAGSLTGTSGLTAANMLLPVFLKGSLSANEQLGEIAVTIGRKSAAEMDLNASEAGAWDAIFSALDNDGKVAGTFLELTDTSALRGAVQQMLPDHAGGVFETVTQGSRATARFLRDPGAPLADRGGWGFWLQQVAWGTTKDLGDTSSYDITGWGAAGGAEVKLGAIGSAGFSLAYLNGRDENGDNQNEVRADQYEAAAYWRGQWGPIRAHARASAALIGLDGTRIFTGKAGNESVSRTATGEWDGRLYSLAGGLSYEANLGRLSLRPALAIDYYRLSEEGYSEAGGGNAFNLEVEDRTSDELAGEATLTLGYDLGSRSRENGWLRAEVEGGRRQILGGSIGETVARFGTGSAFTLDPEDRKDGWVGKLRLMGGNSDFSIGGEFNAEEQHGRAAISFRAALQAAF